MAQRAVVLSYIECSFDPNGDMSITPLVCFIGNAVRDTVAIPVLGIGIDDVAAVVQSKIKAAILDAAPTIDTGYGEIGVNDILGLPMARL